MQVMKWSMIALAVAAGTSQFAMASDQSDDTKGFIDGSTLNLKARTEYMNRDYKNGASNSNGVHSDGSARTAGYRQDSGLGLWGIFESGYTTGTVGFGLDALALGSLKFDGGAGHAGNGLFAKDSSGSEEDSQGKVGAAAKFRISNTTLKVGQQFVSSPVFSTDDSRLLPEVATGGFIDSKEFAGLELTAGKFNSLASQTGMRRDSIGSSEPGTGKGLREADILGAAYSFTDNFTGAVHASKVDDYWKKQYVNLNYTLPITTGQSVNFDLNAYKTEGDGAKLAGDVDNKLYSLAAAYSLGAHKFTFGFQQSTGSSPGGYLYGVDGNGTIYVANSIQISDFIGKDEKSYQARYDINMATYGVPGLSFMTRYVYGNKIDTPTGEGKETEWNAEAKYVVQTGPAKDLSLRLRNAVYRANTNYNNIYSSDLNDLRLIAEYPLNIF